MLNLAPDGIDIEDFVEGVERGVVFYRNHYGLSWQLSGIIFDVASINPVALHYKDQITRKSIRVSDDLLNSEEERVASGLPIGCHHFCISRDE